MVIYICSYVDTIHKIVYIAILYHTNSAWCCKNISAIIILRINEETIIMSNSCFSIRSSSYVIKFLSISSSSSSLGNQNCSSSFISSSRTGTETKSGCTRIILVPVYTENWNNTINYKCI